MRIYKFKSILKSVLWGGNRLATFKELPQFDEPVGESWELSAMPGRESVVAEGDDRGMTLSQLVQRYGADLVGEKVYRRYGTHFPLLIKFIDARRDLSIQVHPDDEMARRLHGCMGKNEMWYILEADAGALIRTGFNRSINVEEFDRRLADGTILDIINKTESRPGETFFIPSGQIHAIGAGNLLVEIQRSSDVTYRVWDYDRRDAAGNLRELHVQQAREALDFAARDCQVHDMPRLDNGMTQLVRCRDFDVRRLELSGSHLLEYPVAHSFEVMICIKGGMTLKVDGMPLAEVRQGETVLVPAIADRVEMRGNGQLLLVSVPD